MLSHGLFSGPPTAFSTHLQVDPGVTIPKHTNVKAPPDLGGVTVAGPGSACLCTSVSRVCV